MTLRELALAAAGSLAIGLLISFATQRVDWTDGRRAQEPPAWSRAEPRPEPVLAAQPARRAPPGAPAGEQRGPAPSGLEDLRQALWNPDLPAEMKLALLENLEDATSPGLTEMLVEVAATADDPELRIGAIEAIALEGSPAARAALPELLTTEADPEVRTELYDALAFDAAAAWENGDVAALANAAASETDPAARLQGFRLAAAMLRFDGSGDLAGRFDREMVPWLREEALRGDSRYARLVAIEALKLAGTDAAVEALYAIGLSRDPDAADAASRALVAQARLRDGA